MKLVRRRSVDPADRRLGVIRFLRVHATSGYTPKLTVKAGVANRPPDATGYCHAQHLL